ncbi:hypothetical protein [Streptomyces cylindrosporus]|uniref:Uncharacterized protein n=1 Tax=Streptomyces cylindrosporus TaxID=2927583 RepID=A0ABS9YJQ4_9ACTN|nr:hypothetical protein [Streptomyces cylindrosporus]MCI3277475.1 hypothetical protein [Streptomyces cylindrosporus]
MLNTSECAVPSSREKELQAENRDLRELVAKLTDRLDMLQTANEGAYKELSIATGGPRFDPAQPFGTDPKRKLGTLFMKGSRP